MYREYITYLLLPSRLAGLLFPLVAGPGRLACSDPAARGNLLVPTRLPFHTLLEMMPRTRSRIPRDLGPKFQLRFAPKIEVLDTRRIRERVQNRAKSNEMNGAGGGNRTDGSD
jgi:hypothetical protein